MTETSPFVPGARVLVETNGRYKGDRVRTVHKSGRFTLEGNPTQQYRPYREHSFKASPGRWCGQATGEGWRKPVAYLWAEDDDDLNQRVARANLNDRFYRARLHLDRITPSKATERAVELLEAALKEIAGQ